MINVNEATEKTIASLERIHKVPLGVVWRRILWATKRGFWTCHVDFDDDLTHRVLTDIATVLDYHGYAVGISDDEEDKLWTITWGYTRD
jgi:hypothetical protein